MVRATRSSQVLIHESPIPSLPQTTRKPAASGKKRKRQSNENADNAMDIDKDHDSDADRPKPLPDTKMLDTEIAKDKPSKKPKIKDEPLVLPESKFKDAGDITMQPNDAAKFLLVLQTIDPNKLLDIPVSVPSLAEPFTHDAQTIRSILNEPSKFAIRSLRSAFLSLRPSDLQPRVTIPQDVRRKLNFCDTALALLDSIALKQRGSVDLKRSNLDPDIGDPDPDGQRDNKRHLFALYQHLPTGEYFTSAAELTPEVVGSLTKGQASVVSITPSIPLDPSSAPSLGSYSRPVKPPVITRPYSEKWNTGAFLDYGPFASFAPVYDSEASSIGSHMLAALLEKKKRALMKRIGSPEILRSRLGTTQSSEVPPPSPHPAELRSSNNNPSHESSVQILPELVKSAKQSDGEPFTVPEMDDDFKAAMKQLELEFGISDLLTENAFAMARLVELQNERYRLGAKAPEPEVGGEEWKLAESILKTLTTLTSLRPRLAGDNSAPLVPPPQILRAVHRTLPTDSAPGWKGTLVRDRDIAYRDNSTIRPGTTPYVAPTPAPAPTPTPVRPTTTTQSNPTTYTNGQTGYAATSNAYPQYQTHYPQQYATAAAGRPGAYYPPSSYYGYPGAQPGTPGATNSAAKPNPAQPYYYPYAYSTGVNPGMYPAQQPGTPGVHPQAPRAIPNMARANTAVQNAWGTPVAATPGTPIPGAGQTLPAHLRKGVGSMPAIGSALPSPGLGISSMYPAALQGGAVSQLTQGLSYSYPTKAP